jgi:hypothetical protein
MSFESAFIANEGKDKETERNSISIKDMVCELEVVMM